VPSPDEEGEHPLPHAPVEDRYTASTTAGHTAIIVGGRRRASLTAHPRQRMRKRVPLGTTESHSTELHAYKGDRQLRHVEMADASASHRCGWCSTLSSALRLPQPASSEPTASDQNPLVTTMPLQEATRGTASPHPSARSSPSPSATWSAECLLARQQPRTRCDLAPALPTAHPGLAPGAPSLRFPLGALPVQDWRSENNKDGREKE
jgi:hypothetical protein